MRATMRGKFFLLFLGIPLLFCMGCASVMVPQYIRDEYPYRKNLYADFGRVQEAVEEALKESGWQVAKTTDPALFERNKTPVDPQARQALIFTEIRQTALFLGTRYARMNIYLHAGPDTTTEVEVRYLTVTSVPFKSFYNHRNDRFVQKWLGRLEVLSGQ